MLFNRLQLLARRRLAARRLHVPFSRAKSLAMPETIRLEGRDIALRLPSEHGVRIAFVELLLDDCYQLRRLVRQGERIVRIIDVGANVGLFGLAARIAFPESIIHAYEPNKALKPYLSHQCLNARANAFYEAVGRKRGHITLDVSGAESVHTTTHLDPTGTIPQIDLRTAIERIGGTVDLLKMDCEGAEWEMLEDPESWRPVRYVTMEYHLRPEQDHKAIVGALDRCGFHVLDQGLADTYGLVFARNTQPSALSTTLPNSSGRVSNEIR